MNKDDTGQRRIIVKKLFIDTLHTISKWIPPQIYPRLVKREVISFFYHAVSNDIMAHVRHLYPVVSVLEFRESLAALQGRFHFVSYDRLHAYYQFGKPLPPRAAHLSFDDGFSECYWVVRPILLELGIPCTFFVTIDWLDNRMLYFRHQISLCVHRAGMLQGEARDDFIQALNHKLGLSLADIAEFCRWITAFRAPKEGILAEVICLLEIDVPSYLEENQPYLTTAQVQELHTQGFTIGAHGLTHRKLGFVSEQDLEHEISASCRSITEITGQAVVPFSFPQSAGNVDRASLANILRRHENIGLLFDTKDLRVDVDFMVNRVWAERPLSPQRALHPIQEVLVYAYRDAWVDGVLGRLRRG
jgi:peptidoglycan/xylan/chitin deacetylase (PgdA/CDA1 family)